jgi:hypothetical protein
LRSPRGPPEPLAPPCIRHLARVAMKPANKAKEIMLSWGRGSAYRCSAQRIVATSKGGGPLAPIRRRGSAEKTTVAASIGAPAQRAATLQRTAQQGDELAPCSGRDAIFIAPPAQIRTCGFPAYGSHLGCVTAKLPYALQRLCHASLVLSPVRALLVRIPLGPRPSLHRLRCVRLRRCLRSGLPSLCSPASQLLWRGPTSRVRASSASVPHLSDADRPSHATPGGQTRDLPGSGAIPLHVMWP